MILLSILILLTGLLSILILSTGLLSILIVMEYLNLGLFLLLMSYFYEEGLMELFRLFVFLIIEAVIGLVLLILKILLSGRDLVDLLDVI